jgi:hypothetical protein
MDLQVPLRSASRRCKPWPMMGHLYLHKCCDLEEAFHDLPQQRLLRLFCMSCPTVKARLARDGKSQPLGQSQILRGHFCLVNGDMHLSTRPYRGEWVAEKPTTLHQPLVLPHSEGNLHRFIFSSSFPSVHVFPHLKTLHTPQSTPQKQTTSQAHLSKLLSLS